MRATTAILSATVLALAACGGGGGDDASVIRSDDPGGALDSDGPETTDEATIEPAEVSLDTSVRYAGFVFHLGDGELGPSEDFAGDPDPTTGRLTIDLQVENLGTNEGAPDSSALHLERDGAVLDVVGFSSSELPRVPGEARSNGTIVADHLPADFTLEGTTLVFGSGAVHQARVALDGSGETVSADPLEITPGEPGKVGEATVTISEGHLRYDDVGKHRQYDADKALLVIEFDMAASAAINSRAGSTYMGAAGSDLQLGLPDGTRVSPEPLSGTDRSVRLDPSETKSGLRIAFFVDADVRGSFELAVKGSYGLDELDEVAGFAPFELDG